MFSAEGVCLKEKCIYLSELAGKDVREPHSSESPPTENRYLNSGFFMGYTKRVLEALEFCISQEKYGITDDQLAMCMYVQQYPKKIALDTTCKLIATVGYNFSDYTHDEIKNRIIYTKTGTMPCFLHTPGNTSDFSYRLDYFGKRILKELYQVDALSTKFTKFKEYFKNNKTIKLYFIIIFLILLFLVYLNPKLILLYIILILIVVVEVSLY